MKHDVPCGDCGSPMELRASRYGRFYGCTRYPECRGTHGAHPDGSPLGQPADHATRAARMRAHAAFDRIWRMAPDSYPGLTVERACGIAKRRMYSWLQEQLELDKDACHIAKMDVAQCEQVVSVCTGVTYEDVREWAHSED